MKSTHTAKSKSPSRKSAPKRSSTSPPRSPPRTANGSSPRGPSPSTRARSHSPTAPALAEHAGVRRIRVKRMDRDADVVDDHIAGARQKRLDLIAVASIVARVVVAAHRRLAAPRPKQHELAGSVGG